MKIALGYDHAGFMLANELKPYLQELGCTVVDFGPSKLDPKDDYPDYILPTARAVVGGLCEFGIVLGGDGQGEAMTANRIKGVRCAVFYGPAVAKGVVDVDGHVSHDPYEVVRLTRRHNDANLLSLGARFLSVTDAKHAIKIWLETKFEHEARHVRRIAKIDKESRP